MAQTPIVKTETKSVVSLTQKIALSFVVAIGLVVVASAGFAAFLTWTENDQSPLPTQTGTPSTSEVLGVDHTFEIPAAE